MATRRRQRWSLSQAAITVVLALLLSEIRIATFNNIIITTTHHHQDIIDNNKSDYYWSGGGVDFNNNKKKSHHNSWSRAIKDAERLLSSDDINNNNNNNNGPISCLHPDIKASQKLAKEFQLDSTKQITFPILNVGFPKCGSMTLYDFFVCAGYTSTHFERNKINKDFEGVCMRDAVSNDLPPIQTCTKGEQAIMQMDSEYPMGISSPWHNEYRDECFFPQISILDEISKENPNTTFIMNFRPINDWIKSVTGWNSNMLGRFQLCDFPNLPRGIPRNLSDSQEVTKVMTKFW